MWSQGENIIFLLSCVVLCVDVLFVICLCKPISQSLRLGVLAFTFCIQTSLASLFRKQTHCAGYIAHYVRTLNSLDRPDISSVAFCGGGHANDVFV